MASRLIPAPTGFGDRNTQAGRQAGQPRTGVPAMDAELAELLKLATAAYAEHGDKQIYFVVHEVELSGKTVDHDISPYGCSHQEGGGVVVEVGNQRCGPSIYSHHDAESERQQFRQLAQVCGAWLTANGRIDFSPLPSPIGRWCLELLKLPTIHREHRKSVWYCNAFGATLIVLRLVAAERQVNSGVGPTFQSVSEVNESGKSNQRESVVTEQRRSDEGAVASGNKTDRSEPSESLRQGYDDRGNYWRNAWLYNQRSIGKTIPKILEELEAKAEDYELLYSANAVRKAIKSIAEYHGWPVLQGKIGRPKSSRNSAD
jgi:hypothetical protein